MIEHVKAGKTHLPAGHDAPQTVEQAILAAHALLKEEGRWAYGSWFRNNAALDPKDPHYEEYKDTPYCNAWSTCMMGALRVVTVGMSQRKLGTDTRPYWVFSMSDENGMRTDDAATLYRRTEALVNGMAENRDYDSGVAFNDAYEQTREGVLKFLTECAAEAARRGL